MAITTNKPYKQAQEEFLAIKCALKGPVDECRGKGEETWKLPCLNPNIRPESAVECVAPCAFQVNQTKSESPAKSKK